MMAMYIVIDVGNMGKKDERVIKMKNYRAKEGSPISDIVFIDGFKKESASKL